MIGRRGFSLIEVIVVMAIVAITLGMAGPRIGAGIGNLELRSAENSVQSLVKLGKVQAERADRQHYVVVNGARHTVSLLGPDLQLLREEAFADSISLVSDTGADLATVYVAPSGLLRTTPIRLRGRAGEREVGLR